MLSVIVLSDIMLNVIFLNVVAPVSVHKDLGKRMFLWLKRLIIFLVKIWRNMFCKKTPISSDENDMEMSPSMTMATKRDFVYSSLLTCKL